ncbi:MAG TPA: 30S ribosomal protein S20 [Candidatus Brocadiia bacterium]|nr:30S ribosomal protein S20 [Candidatus Brocadiia bacterium]
MAHTKSARKTLRQDAKRRFRNKTRKTQMRNQMRKLRTSVEHGELDAAKAQLPVVYKYIDRAASQGAIHKNQAARRKARIAMLVNKLAASKS